MKNKNYCYVLGCNTSIKLLLCHSLVLLPLWGAGLTSAPLVLLFDLTLNPSPKERDFDQYGFDVALLFTVLFLKVL